MWEKGVHLVVGGGEESGVGKVVCDYVKENKIDFLVMGRREGRGGWERFFGGGSSSEYCLANAECNLVVIKKYVGPENPKQTIHGEG